MRLFYSRGECGIQRRNHRPRRSSNGRGPADSGHRRRRHRAGGGHVPPKFLTAGAQVAQHNLWGTCKKIKKISKKAKYSAKEVFSVSSLSNGHTATQQLCRSYCVLCRHRQQLDTASIRRHPVSQSGKRNPKSTPIL